MPAWFAMPRTLALVALLAMLSASVARAEEMLRIAVTRTDGELAISGPDLVVTDPAGGQIVHHGSPVKLAPAERGILVDGQLVGVGRLVVTSRGSLSLRAFTLDRQVEVFQERRGTKARLLVVHEVPIEAYVAATVSSEMPTSWHPEALKVQAVASRTFAVFRKFNVPDRPYHMEAGVIDQVYGGAGKVAPSAREATRATRGEVVTYRRRPIRAYFHSCCAGHTESAREGWGQKLAYLPGVSCGYDKDCSSYHYTVRLALPKVAAALRKARLRVKRIDSLRIVKRTKTGRVAKMVLETDGGPVTLSGEDLRRLVGYGVIKSRSFDAKIVGDQLLIEGQGSGHGVGLCQWGARGMARAKKGYRQILKHYYPRTKIMKMY